MLYCPDELIRRAYRLPQARFSTQTHKQESTMWRLRITQALAAMIVGLGFSAVPSFAEELVLEEIVVTATRRAETDVQTTPVAVSAVSQEEFSRLFAQDIGEVAAFVPNFSAATITGFNAASFAMRGAAETDIIVYFDPKVGVIVDDFVVPHVQTQLLEPFDIEAIVARPPRHAVRQKHHRWRSSGSNQAPRHGWRICGS